MTEIEFGKPRPKDDCYRILVLDDKPQHMEEITRACKAVGQEVVPVTSIREGLLFLETKDHVDVVVAEAFLQSESVFDLLQAVRKIPGHQEVPIMIVAINPGQIAQFCTEMMERTAKVLGAYKFLVMSQLDVPHLMREIDAVLPHEDRPRREEDSDDT